MKFYGFLLQWSLLSLGLTANPGIKVRITKKALIDGQQFGTEFLKQKLIGAVSKDWKGQDRYYLIPYDCTLSGITVDNVEFHHTSMFFIPETGIHMLSVFTANVSLDWMITTWFASDSGRANITISMVFRPVVKVSQNETGHPSLLLKYCEARITELNIQLGEKSGFLNSAAFYFLEGFINNHLNNNALCPYINEEIQRISMELRKYPALVQFDPFIQIDTSLIDPPVINETYMDLDLKGTVYPADNVIEPPFKPAPFMLSDVYDSMLHIGVSEYFFQSASLAYYSSGVFNISVGEELSPFLQLRTDTLSKIIPTIARFPEPHPLMLNLAVTAPPVVTLRPGRFILQFPGSVDVLAVIPDSSTQSLLFTLNITAIIHAKTTILEQKLVSELFLDSFNLSLVHSKVGHFKVSLLETLVNDGLENGIIPHINAFLKKGFPLPKVDKLKFVDTALQVHQGYLMISTDFKL